MNLLIDPQTIAPPYRHRYSHAFVIPSNARLLISSGTVGVEPDGGVPADFGRQVELVMSNLSEILQAAGMGWDDVVKFTGYLKPQCDMATFAEIRHRYFSDPKPGMTLVWVSGLVDARWMLEVEIIAAQREVLPATSWPT